MVNTYSKNSGYHNNSWFVIILHNTENQQQQEQLLLLYHTHTYTHTHTHTHTYTHTQRPSEDKSHQGQGDKNGNKKHNYKAIIHCILYQINFWAYDRKHILISQTTFWFSTEYINKIWEIKKTSETIWSISLTFLMNKVKSRNVVMYHPAKYLHIWN